jgi:NNP family nitrate/nitrite transporter-like MFS transporter
VLFLMRRMQIRWTRTWAEKGGRARVAAPDLPQQMPLSEAHARVST